MKKQNPHQNSKDGFALLVVLFFVASISTLLAMLAFSSSQRAFTARKLNDQIRAKAQAEAGCEYAYAILSTDWASRYDPSAFVIGADEGTAQLSSVGASLTASDDASTFLITVTPVGENSALVTSTGTCGVADSVSIISVQDIGGSDLDGDVLSGEAFDFAILSGGEMDFTGCGSILTPSGSAKFHSNSAMYVRGATDPQIDLSSSSKIRISNNVEVGGNVTAPNLQYNSNKVTIDGTASEAEVPSVTIPDIDLTPYWDWARRHGELYNGYSSSSSYTPNGGILWVDGDVEISGNAVITGSIIATGSIKISGSATINPTKTAFAVASRDGDIEVTSSGTITGLIYGKTGGFSYTANGNINGQIIVNGAIKKAGNSDIMTSYDTYVPSPPEDSVTTEYIAIAAWQE